MVTRSAPAGGRLLVLAGVLAAVLVPLPAAAGEATATMRVHARVVESCRIRLPEPAQVGDRLPDHVGDLVEHRCHRPVRPHITTSRPSGVISQRDDGGDHILITLTY